MPAAIATDKRKGLQCTQHVLVYYSLMHLHQRGDFDLQKQYRQTLVNLLIEKHVHAASSDVNVDRKCWNGVGESWNQWRPDVLVRSLLGLVTIRLKRSDLMILWAKNISTQWYFVKTATTRTWTAPYYRVKRQLFVWSPGAAQAIDVSTYYTALWEPIVSLKVERLGIEGVGMFGSDYH